MSLNRVEVSGGIVRDAKLEHLPSGAPLWEATVAVDETVFSSREGGRVVHTNYFVVQAWGWLAEELATLSLGKGDEVYVLGSLSQRSFERKNGDKESKTRIRALTVTPTKRRAPSAPPAAGPEFDPASGLGGWGPNIGTSPF